METTVNRYRVWLRSVPGMYEQYDGYVDVTADDETEAGQLAIRELCRNSFKDRNPSMWRVERVERRS